MKIDKKILKHILVNTKATAIKAKEKKIIADEQLFKANVATIKPLIQDKVSHVKTTIAQKRAKNKAFSDKLEAAEFYFSDEYEPHLPRQGAMRYVREGVDSFESKALRRGDYIPELILDLHGLNQQQTKHELSALLQESKKHHINCVCIIHGIGSKILKNKVPHWLVQHPMVMAFHQATLEWGGNGALLVLLEVKEK